jgi:hypothetical protein
MDVSAHYQYYIVPGVVVYDLRGLSLNQKPLDVHTAFLEFAKRLKEKRYSRVELSYRGTTKFSINGEAFHKLGEEYTKHNFEFALYSFARMFQPEDGTRPLDESISDRDALLEFHRQWYGQDGMTKPVENGLLAR